MPLLLCARLNGDRAGTEMTYMFFSPLTEFWVSKVDSKCNPEEFLKL